MRTTPRNRTVIWNLVALTIIMNIAGYALDLYHRFGWFDSAIHLYNSFILALALAPLLYGAVLTRKYEHRLVLILVLACIGVAVGTLWEVGEWIYDLIVPGDNILGKTDTIHDLIWDGVGALLGGALGVRIVRA